MSHLVNLYMEPGPGEVLCGLERLWLDLEPSASASRRESQIELGDVLRSWRVQDGRSGKSDE